MSKNESKKLCVLTSGGDAQGMTAALRAVVRTGLGLGLDVHAAHEGYDGLVRGGEGIRPIRWNDVSGILHLGGTIIGTARSPAFRERSGRLRAAGHLVERGIDRLIVVGGDGSLTGADQLRREWPELIDELVASGAIPRQQAERHPRLTVVGLVGSIDNDMAGTDMTIGADTGLRRITEAIDALNSTAASHQRSFVVEVMGRDCGYLALMGALAAGADWVFVPEAPPAPDKWQAEMCKVLKAYRDAGRRNNIVIVAEGAKDREGKPITCAQVKQVLEERLGQDTRITILGHVQRGGSPSAFDRYMSTVLGHAAVHQVLSEETEGSAQLIGMRENHVYTAPLEECIERTREVREAVASQRYEQAIALRGGSFQESLTTFRTLARTNPRPPQPGQRRLRFAVLNASGPAPGMNTATRAAVRLCLDKGHHVLGVRNGFEGLIAGAFEPMDWMSVEGWTSLGGAELGTTRKIPEGEAFYSIARNLEDQEIHGLLMIGGWSGYEAAYQLFRNRDRYPAFNLPILCLPASINNNLPGSAFSIGADTALNNIVDVVDKIKQSAVAANRTFVVEVMGRYCGYLALMSGLATGAERIYLHEEGITLRNLEHDVELLSQGFREGKRLGLVIRNEYANWIYTTPFICALFEEEGGNLFSVRQSILGHFQQGGDPSPFDRIQATRLASRSIEFLVEQAEKGHGDCAFVGLEGGRVRFYDMEAFPRMVDRRHKRPKEQWWMELRPIARVLARPGAD